MRRPLPSTADPRDVDATMQAVRLQLFRENIGGALDLVEAAQAAHPDPRYAEQAVKIRGWLTHLGSREAYLAAQEDQYRRGGRGARGPRPPKGNRDPPRGAAQKRGGGRGRPPRPRPPGR